MRLFTLALAAIGALVMLVVALSSPEVAPAPSAAATCEDELRACRAASTRRAAERLLRCIADPDLP